MLKQSALRIGNLVSHEGQWKPVTLEILKLIKTNSTDYFALGKGSSVTAIRISDYFTKHYPNINPVTFFTKARVFEVTRDSGNENAWQVSTDDYKLTILTHIHQLQNVVQSLALEELNLPEMSVEPMYQ